MKKSNAFILLGFLLFACGATLVILPFCRYLSEIDGDSVVPDLIYIFSAIAKQEGINPLVGFTMLVIGLIFWVIGLLSYRPKARGHEEKKPQST